MSGSFAQGRAMSRPVSFSPAVSAIYCFGETPVMPQEDFGEIGRGIEAAFDGDFRDAFLPFAQEPLCPVNTAQLYILDDGIAGVTLEQPIQVVLIQMGQTAELFSGNALSQMIPDIFFDRSYSCGIRGGDRGRPKAEWTWERVPSGRSLHGRRFLRKRMVILGHADQFVRCLKRKPDDAPGNISGNIIFENLLDFLHIIPGRRPAGGLL